MDTTITVYAMPGCVQCTATQRALDASEIEYDVVDLSADDTELERIRALGYFEAPVVIVEPDGGARSGFRPDLIADLAMRLEYGQVATC